MSLPLYRGRGQSLDLSCLHELLKVIMNQKTRATSSRVRSSPVLNDLELYNLGKPSNYLIPLTEDDRCVSGKNYPSWKLDSPTEHCGKRSFTGRNSCGVVGQMTVFFTPYVFLRNRQDP